MTGPIIETMDFSGVASGESDMDFPTAWALQKECGESLDRHPRCSSVPGWHPFSGPGLLCDCGALGREWDRRKGATP